MCKKLVTCIIPTRDRQYLLGKALDSVISQTYKKLEIIVVDDASNDDTESLVMEYMVKESRIKYIKNFSAKGGGGARNIGIKAAKGDYIAFLDDDDKWEKSKIYEQIKNIKNYEALLCASNVKSKSPRVKKYDKTSVDLNDLRKGNYFTGGTSTLMARSSIIKENHFDEALPIGQDWDLLIRIARKYRLGYLNCPLIDYNDGQHKRITNKKINMPFGQLEKKLSVIYKHEEFFGPYLFNYHRARILLSYIKYRNRKVKHIFYTLKSCGFYPVMRVFYNKIYRNILRI